MAVCPKSKTRTKMKPEQTYTAIIRECDPDNVILSLEGKSKRLTIRARGFDEAMKSAVAACKDNQYVAGIKEV